MTHGPDTPEFEISVTEDATGLLCPEPVIRARARLDAMEPGQVLSITTTDPMADVDFRIFCSRTGHKLLAVEAGDKATRFLIQHR